MPRGFESGRLFGPDAARGIALLGMFAAHVVFDPAENLYDGRSSILFATVAGVSLGLMTGGSRTATVAGRGAQRGAVALRGLSLIVIGVFLTVVVDPPLAVILDYYGFAFLLLVPLLFAPRRVLAVAVVAVVAVLPAVVGWARDAGSLAEVPAALQPFARWLVFGTYPMAIWVAFVLTGLLCARCDLTARRTPALMVAGGLAAAVAGYGSAVVVPGATAAAHSGSMAEVLGSGGVAVAVIGAATLAGDLPGVAGRGIRLVLYPVAAAGGMALTLYVVQAIALAITRDLVSGGAERWEYPAGTLAVLVVASLTVGTLWRLGLGAGPLERLLRLVSALASPRAARTAPKV
jgi:hypothetical protein